MDDEAFWREQEKRRQRLDQPCCTQSNMSWALFDLPGDLCVVIHGESDCLNCFFHHGGRNGHRFFSSRLTDHLLTTGETGSPLRHLLELIAKERAPEAVIVLGTCPVEVIGDRFEEVVEAVSEETGLPMVALHTHGLALMSLTRCQDWLYATLAGLPQHEADRDGVNLIGLPPNSEREVRAVLAGAGVRVNGIYPNATALEQWRRIGNAEKSYVVDPSVYKQLLRVLKGHGVPHDEVPFPMGTGPTRSFYEAVLGDVTGIVESLEASYAGLRDRVAAKAAGVRLTVCIRMLKTHRSDKLAYDGLGEVAMLRELGFDIDLLVQGPPEEAPRKRFADRLEQRGYGDLDFDVFLGPWKLGEALTSKGSRIAVMSDVARNVVEDAGVVVIPNGSFRPFYGGMAHNLARIERALEQL